jgi:protein gp37
MIPEATDLIDYGEGWQSLWGQGQWPENVWIGATVCNQEEADRDIPKLLEVPAAVRFLSMEPLLGAVDLTKEYLALKCDGAYPFRGLPNEHRTKLINLIDWVIVGGESGPKARPMHPDWARSIRDQCAAAGVPFLFKQWGEWAHDSRIIDAKGNTFHRFEDGTWMQRVGKREASRLLDGVEHNDYPAARDSQILISKVE